MNLTAKKITVPNNNNLDLPIPNQSLIDSAKSGNRQAQKQIYEQYYGRMLSIVHRYIRDKEKSKELVNTGFLKAFNSFKNYTDQGSLVAWLSIIMKRTAINELRLNKQETIEIKENHFPSTYNFARDKHNAEYLYELIHQLPPATRIVFNLHIIEGYKLKEISKSQHISLGTVKWHISNARTILQSKINRYV